MLDGFSKLAFRKGDIILRNFGKQLVTVREIYFIKGKYILEKKIKDFDILKDKTFPIYELIDYSGKLYMEPLEDKEIEGVSTLNLQNIRFASERFNLKVFDYILFSLDGEYTPLSMGSKKIPCKKFGKIAKISLGGDMKLNLEVDTLRGKQIIYNMEDTILNLKANKSEIDFTEEYIQEKYDVLKLLPQELELWLADGGIELKGEPIENTDNKSSVVYL